MFLHACDLSEFQMHPNFGGYSWVKKLINVVPARVKRQNGKSALNF
jgi:hypothetical protein